MTGSIGILAANNKIKIIGFSIQRVAFHPHLLNFNFSSLNTLLCKKR